MQLAGQCYEQLFCTVSGFSILLSQLPVEYQPHHAHYRFANSCLFYLSSSLVDLDRRLQRLESEARVESEAPRTADQDPLSPGTLPSPPTICDHSGTTDE